MTQLLPNDVPSVTFAVLFIGALIVATFWILRLLLIKRGAAEAVVPRQRVRA